MMMNVGIIQKSTTVASNHSESSPYISYHILSHWHNQARGEHRFVVVVTQTRALFD